MRFWGSATSRQSTWRGAALYLVGVLAFAFRVANAVEAPADANCDGLVDHRDLLALQQSLFDSIDCAAGDVNLDGRRSAADLVGMVQFLFRYPATPTPEPQSPTPVEATHTPEEPTSTPTGIPSQQTASPTSTQEPEPTSTAVEESPLPTATRTGLPEASPTAEPSHTATAAPTPSLPEPTAPTPSVSPETTPSEAPELPSASPSPSGLRRLRRWGVACAHRAALVDAFTSSSHRHNDEPANSDVRCGAICHGDPTVACDIQRHSDAEFHQPCLTDAESNPLSAVDTDRDSGVVPYR